MKRIVAFICSLVILVPFFGCQKAEPDLSLQKLTDRKVFSIALDTRFMPTSFKDENGTFSGFALEVAKEVAKRMGVTLNIQELTGDKAAIELVNGGIDCIWIATEVPENFKGKLTPINNYFNVDSALLTVTEKNRKSLADIKPQFVIGTVNDYYAAICPKKIKANHKVYDSVDKAISDLAADVIQGIMLDDGLKSYTIRPSEGYYSAIRLGYGQVFTGPIFKKDAKLLREAISKVLAEMKADGRLEALSYKWFGDSLIS